MNKYELSYLASSEISEEELGALSEKITTLLKEEKGEIIEEPKPVRKTLAYPIKKQRYAYFGTLIFSMEPENIIELSNKLKTESQVLRFIILARSERAPRKMARRLIKHVEEQPKSEKPKGDKKVEIEEIDKKLSEILGEI